MGTTEMTQEGSIAEQIMRILLEKIPSEKSGPPFVEQAMQSLTSCLSFIIEAGYCPEHYNTGLAEAIRLIKADLRMTAEEPPK
jgi:hypothetical protein